MINLQKANPLLWFDEWDFKGLSKDDKKEIAAGLLNLHCEYLLSSTEDHFVDGRLVRRAFGLIAEKMLLAGVLTEEKIQHLLPSLVSDVAISSCWGFASGAGRSEPTLSHSLQFGNYWVYQDYPEMLAAVLEPEALTWRAKLLVASTSSAGEDGSKRASSSMSDLKNKRVAGGLSGSGNPLEAESTSGQSWEHFMSADRYDFSAKFKGQSEIQIAGPADLQLTIYPVPNRWRVDLLRGPPRPARDYYLWHIHNRSLRSVSNIRLELSSIQSFDERQSAFREPIPLGFEWPLLNVGAGDQTEPATFLMADGENLRLGSSDDMPILPWPNGDSSVIRCWRLSMRVTGLSEGWPIELDVRWTLASKTLELMECSAETRQTRNRPMKTTMPDLFECIEKWVGGLRDTERVQIAELWLEEDTKYRRLDSHADSACMLEAYSRLAPLLKGAGVLTKDIVELKLPELIWELAMAVGRVDVNERYGHQESRLRRFEGLRQLWQAKLEHGTPKAEEVLDSVQSTGQPGTLVEDIVSVVEGREERLQAFQKDHSGATFADIGGDVVDQGKRKGDLTLLQKGNGRLYDSVDFPTAEKYADISPRRRQQLIREKVLEVMGRGQNRRITVKSLMAYCPPSEDTN